MSDILWLVSPKEVFIIITLENNSMLTVRHVTFLRVLNLLFYLAYDHVFSLSWYDIIWLWKLVFIEWRSVTQLWVSTWTYILIDLSEWRWLVNAIYFYLIYKFLILYFIRRICLILLFVLNFLILLLFLEVLFQLIVIVELIILNKFNIWILNEYLWGVLTCFQNTWLLSPFLNVYIRCDCNTYLCICCFLCAFLRLCNVIQKLNVFHFTPFFLAGMNHVRCVLWQEICGLVGIVFIWERYLSIFQYLLVLWLWILYVYN